MKLTNHFDLSELTYTSLEKYLDENRKQAEPFKESLAMVCLELEKLREYIARPIIITSGFRYPELNFKIGGSKTSQHMVGEAVDFTIKDFEEPNSLRLCFNWCKDNLNYGQLIFENPYNKRPWIHFGLPREGRNKTAYIFNGKEYEPV